MHSVCIVELKVTASHIKILRISQKCFFFFGESVSLQKHKFFKVQFLCKVPDILVRF
jgi:hypothetical protein